MKKLFFFALIASCAYTKIQAQISVTVLQRIDDTVYTDLKLSGTGNNLIGLSYFGNDNVLNIRTYNGTGFGTLINRHILGTANSYFTHLVTTGNYVYAVGLQLQAVNLLNPNAPANGAEQYIGHYIASRPEIVNNRLYLQTNATAFTDRIYLYGLQNPMLPALTDSLDLPQGGSMKVTGSHLYYFYTDTLLGKRILSYNLSATPPYLTPAQTLNINNATGFDAIALDIDGDHLYAKTSDSLFHLRINSTGNLQWQSRIALTGNPVNILAQDTVLLVQDRQIISLYNSGNNHTVAIDSTDRFSFNSFQRMERIGNNFYYNSLMQMVMIKLVKTTTGIALPAANDDLHIYPNPVSTQWHINSKTSGLYKLLALDGRCMITGALNANEPMIVDVATIPAGNYYFIRMDDKGRSTAVSLVKE